MELKNIWTLALGDSYCDGHGMHKDILYKSNRTAEQVVEMMFKIKEVYGIDIKSLASDYEDSLIPFDVKNKLEELGMSFDVNGFEIHDYEIYPYDESDEDSDWYMTVDGYVDILIFLLKKIDSELIMEEFSYKTINYVQVNINGRSKSIGSLGYGLFSH
ncbi:MAG: hypothetical protein ACRC5M_00275 [Anaeroplasmataceae bacterium]